MENHPNGQHADGAREKIDFLEEEAAWEKAKAAHTVLAYYEYDQAYSEGRYHGQALEAIAELEEAAAWQDAQRRNKLSSYRKYTSDYPQGKHRAEAEAAMAAIIAGHEKPVAARPRGGKMPSVDAPSKAGLAKPSAPSPVAGSQIKKWMPVAAGALVLIVAAVWGIGKITGPKPLGGDTEFEASIGNTVELGGKTYPVIRTKNGVMWMAQNLNYAADDSWLTPESAYPKTIPHDPGFYGRLYTWEAAKKACEAVGWRLPSDEEWHTFHEQFGERGAYKYLFEGGNSGLNLLAGGYRNPGGQYHDLGKSGAYWSGTQAEKGGQSYRYFGFDGQNKKSYWYDRDGQYGYSCRCILDKASEKAKFSGQVPSYVVSVSSHEGEVQAQAGVKALMEAGYAAGYLWLPDYSTVSNVEMYLVYIGPFSSAEQCGKAVEAYQKVDPNAYGVRIARDKERVEIRGVGKVSRISDYNPGS